METWRFPRRFHDQSAYGRCVTGRIHDIAARGFERGAADYEEGRPGYPAAVVEAIGVSAGFDAVDLGAGTGKFTRLLATAGASVVAVEPVEAMRLVFREVLPNVEVVDGTGESIPLPDASADVVTAAQAFHWLDAERALE